MESANIKVLVVDDEVLVRKSVVKVLKRDGLDVTEAEDGYKAIELAKNNDFDIIVTDVRMPGIDGIETIKEIKKDKPGIKTIVMTGFASENTPVEAIRLGVNDYIYKPFELEEFRHCVNRNINMIKLEKQNKKLEDDNIRSQKLAAIGNMTNTIVHDVKNALTTIIGFTKLVKKHEANAEKVEKYSDIILSETNSILDKLQEILEFTRGNIGMNCVTIPVKELFDSIYLENKNTLEVCNVEFKEKFDEELADKNINIDKKRISQVFFNLISNSKDAMVDSEVKNVILDFGKQDNEVVIKLKDTGKGISKENLQKLFEPFFTFGKEHGTGLGLAIVHQVIEKSGGKISVDSVEGEGTEFEIRLPLVENSL